MLYIRVYAPNGEPFDVVRDVADNLLLNLGWTQTEPVIAEGTIPEVASKSKRDAE